VPDPVPDPEEVFHRHQRLELLQSQATEAGTYSEVYEPRSTIREMVNAPDYDSDATVELNPPAPPASESVPDHVNSTVDADASTRPISPYVPVRGAGRAAVRSALTLLSACSRQADQETIDLSSSSDSSVFSSSESELERITIVTRTSRRIKTETWWCHITVRTDSEGESEKEERKKRRTKRRKKMGNQQK
jgi:hypothetical protein